MTIRSKSVYPTLRSLQLDTEPGCCIFCGDPIPDDGPERFRLHCGHVGCEASYDRIRKSDGRASQRAAANRTDYETARRLISEAMELLRTMRRRMTHADAARRR